MDLPDCPPGTEGYQDSVFEVPKKPEVDDSCTKAEREFQEHLNSLKIRLEDGTTRCMVERRGRDLSGKWTYRCYPCAAMCSGETVLQTHISGKKHKSKLSMRTVWPTNIFDERPFKPNAKSPTDASEQVLQKMAREVEIYNKDPNDLDEKFKKMKNVRCHIQETLDNMKTPLLGIEYLIEFPPDQPHHEPTYMCTLCDKQGHPRTIPNHLTCFWHRSTYFARHFPKASTLLSPFRSQMRYREGVRYIMNRLAQRIEDKFGRMRPLHVDKDDYAKEKDAIRQWIARSYHFSEHEGTTFEEVVDIGLIESLDDSYSKGSKAPVRKEPSPPVVVAPVKPQFNTFNRPAGRQQRRGGSAGSLSDVSEEFDARRPDAARHREEHKSRYEPYPRREPSPFRAKYAIRNTDKSKTEKKVRPPNYEHKIKLAKEKQDVLQASMKKTLAYHEKNPEKHPLYPEEWKNFWNRRYKEIQSEGKDPSKHDFKPEWIVFWTGRMKELHYEELRVQVMELYRRLCLSPPNAMLVEEPAAAPQRDTPDWKTSPPEWKGGASEPRRRSPERRRSPRRPEPRRRSPEARRRSPEVRKRSPEVRKRSAEPRRRSPLPRTRSPDRRELRLEHDRRSPSRRSIPPRRSPPRSKRTRSRSPIPPPRSRSPARTNFVVDSLRRSRSPLSLRAESMRNRSPLARREPPPSQQTVLISDDELKPDDGLSPWNSDNDIESVDSIPEVRSVAGSMASRSSRPSRASLAPHELGPPENIVATLRLLLALEDYLGSLGPKVVDLLTQAIRMEKEKANSSEELLERESALVLLETAKEKLKGAVQAGLVAHAAAPAVRAAVVRAAATLHVADVRATKRKRETASSKKAEGVPVAGVGEVDRAQIAQQMAEALIAQGKTDVSAEELAQLVEAVVGMAEAKRREAEGRAGGDQPAKQRVSGTASALQMLQSAYNEHDKKIEKEDVPDAMDGLSDSDLETLLKNFNELSAEEQHSLIAFLKKLEVKEPERVERLRQYVSAAAAPKPDDEPRQAPTAVAGPVAIESDDDDDYTVEEVFKSATQKVKEDQIQQEMEIVKKSLENSKIPPLLDCEPKGSPSLDLSQAFSSASDLLAFLQTNMQSTSATASTVAPATDIVASGSQPRSFGDAAEPAKPFFTEPPQMPAPSAPISVLTSNAPPENSPQGGLLPTPNPMSQINYGGPHMQNDHGHGGWNTQPTNNTNAPPVENRMANVAPYGDDRMSDVGHFSQNRGPVPDNAGPMQNRTFSQPPRYDNYSQNQYNQGPRGNFMNGGNFDSRPEPNNQYGNNYGHQNNFRGRGGRGQRGRGRGYY